jgi:hypothetical protein
MLQNRESSSKHSAQGSKPGGKVQVFIFRTALEHEVKCSFFLWALSHV